MPRSACKRDQCECGLPVPHMQHEPGLPLHDGASEPPPFDTDDANTDNFFVSLVEPQCGHAVPFQSLERTRISLSFSHFPQ